MIWLIDVSSIPVDKIHTHVLWHNKTVESPCLIPDMEDSLDSSCCEWWSVQSPAAPVQLLSKLQQGRGKLFCRCWWCNAFALNVFILMLKQCLVQLIHQEFKNNILKSMWITCIVFVFVFASLDVLLMHTVNFPYIFIAFVWCTHSNIFPEYIDV